MKKFSDVDNPCKPECPNRTATCHGECSLYIIFYEKKRSIERTKALHQKSKHIPKQFL